MERRITQEKKREDPTVPTTIRTIERAIANRARFATVQKRRIQKHYDVLLHSEDEKQRLMQQVDEELRFVWGYLRVFVEEFTELSTYVERVEQLLQGHKMLVPINVALIDAEEKSAISLGGLLT